MTPLLTFIIPVYNLPVALVKECLHSIMDIALTEEEREVIVVDDGSRERFDDQLGDLLEKIIYVRTENQGLGPARNTGISLAKGQFIQFVDGDDALIPYIYNKCIEQVRLHKPDMVMFAMTHNQTKPHDKKCNFSDAVDGSEYMLNHNLRGAACGYIFRREILGDLRFNNIICEDEEFTPQLVLRAKSVVNTNSAAYFYRVREGSIINNTDDTRQQHRFNDILGVITRLRDLAQTLTDNKRQALTRRVAQLTMDYIYNQWNYRRSVKALKKTLKQLGELGLYPLPSDNYTFKYTLFRQMLKLI